MHPLAQYITQDGTPIGKAIATFAAKLGRHPSTIDRIIRGTRNPGPDLIRDIFKATNGQVTADTLLIQSNTPAVAPSPANGGVVNHKVNKVKGKN